MNRPHSSLSRMFRISLLTLAAAGASAAPPTPLGTDFTYQGKVTLDGAPLTATADLRFTLFNDSVAGAVVGFPLQVNNALVVGGIFTATIDFGAEVFNGEARWIEIEVRSPSGVGAFQKLSPREPVSALPYALQTRGLFTDELLRVGIGTTTPAERLNVRGNLRIDAGDLTIWKVGTTPSLSTAGNGQYLEFFNPVTLGSTSAQGTSLDGSGFIELYTKNGFLNALLEGDLPVGPVGTQTGALVLRSTGTGATGGLVKVQNNDGADRITISGGPSAEGGVFSMLTGNGQTTIRLTGDIEGFGGEFRTNDEAGNLQSMIQPDADGTGVFMFLARDTNQQGLAFDGNAGGSGNPRLDLFGANPVTFNTNIAGDSSVVLPANAISAGEILDEPGVANIHANTVALTFALAAVASRSITVPAAGFVLALAQGDLQIIHSAGNIMNCAYGVSMSATSLPADQDVQTQIPAALPAGNYDFSASAHGLFAVPAGTSTFFFAASKSNNADAANMFDIQLTLVYFPTAYGSTQSNLEIGPGGENERGALSGPLAIEEIELEQDQELDRVQQQMNAEIDRMQARMNELQAHLDELKREQSSGRIPATPMRKPASNITTRPVNASR